MLSYYVVGDDVLKDKGGGGDTKKEDGKEAVEKDQAGVVDDHRHEPPNPHAPVDKSIGKDADTGAEVSVTLGTTTVTRCAMTH